MTRLRHRLDGRADAPVIVLGPSLGTTLDLWEPQLPALTASWRVLRYELPGHGGSAAIHGTVDDFAAAVTELLDLGPSPPRSTMPGRWPAASRRPSSWSCPRPRTWPTSNARSRSRTR